MKKTFLILLALGGIFLAIQFLLPFLFPFILGALLALAAEPGVRFLTTRLRLPRAAASGIGVGAVFAVICAVLTLLVGLALRELRVLAGILPQMELTARSGLEALQLWLLNLSERTSPGIRSLLQRNVNTLFSDGTAMLDGIARQALSMAGSFLTQLPDGALGIGTAVLAAADGVVRTAGSHKSYGNYVRILHADGDETLYAHMQYLFVRAGERVTAGQTLGTVGQTGNATGPHLHFEILHKGLRYDPAQALQDAA